MQICLPTARAGAAATTLRARTATATTKAKQ